MRDKKATPVEGMAEVDVRALVHELQVHQIELEMQNEELQRAQAAAQEASEKYYDLFDFAPVGLFPCGTTRGGFWRSTWPGPPCWAWTEARRSSSGSGNSWPRKTAPRLPISAGVC